MNLAVQLIAVYILTGANCGRSSVRKAQRRSLARQNRKDGDLETKSENTLCTIHWDILKDMKSEDSKIIADGKVIYQAGKWLI